MSSPSAYQKARDLGLNDEDIIDRISKKHPDFKEKYQKALKLGYSPEEIINKASLSYQKAKTHQKPQEKPESLSKSALRTVLQPVSGFLEATTPGIAASFWQLLGTGEALDPESIDEIEKISEREGVPFDREKYMQAAQTALEYIPTVGNIGRVVEEQTGIPLEAKTGIQKSLRLGTSAAKFTPGSISQKAVAGVAAPLVKKGLMVAGVPEPFAELGGLGVSVPLAVQTPPVSVAAKTKPSGLTTRRFESVSKPTQVTPGTKQRIDSKIENEFKDIYQTLEKAGPAEKTAQALKDDIGFKNKITDLFRDVEIKASEIPGTVSGKEISERLLKTREGIPGKGFAANEYDKAYRGYINEISKEMEGIEATPAQLVQQFRKNNKELGEYYAPGKSRSDNRAKKDALLDFNRSISDTIKEKYPDSEFGKLFDYTNNKWKEIKDIEFADKFIDDLFDGKIRFEKGKSIFEKENAALPFKRILGQEGYIQFEQLMKDLLSSETPYRMLKVAEDAGWKELAKTGLYFVLNPKVAYVKTAYDLAKTAARAMLDKPQIGITWRKGIDNLKKGKFAEAERNFEEIKKETFDYEKRENLRKETLKKFNEEKKSKTNH